MNIKLLLACLSPEEIGISLVFRNYAVVLAGIVSVVVMIYGWRHRDYRWITLCGILLLVHPAWTTNVYAGDCGYGSRFWAAAISVIFVAILGCQLCFQRLRLKWFVLTLSIVAWMAFGASQLYWRIVDYTSLIGLLSQIFSSTAVESFLFASPMFFRVAIVSSVVSGLLLMASSERLRFGEKVSHERGVNQGDDAGGV
jgi:hypothetical protein